MSEEFAVLVYKDKGPHQRAGGTYDYTLVGSPEELAVALAAGWFETLPEAIAPKDVAVASHVASNTPEADDTAPPTRDELKAKAAELGLVFPANASDKKLADLIKATLEA